MQLNMQRIDEKIHRLQEIKRIAADPEMVKMLMEFISTEDEPHQHGPALAADPANGNAQPRYDDMAEVTKIVNQIDDSPRAGGLWARPRG
jgi:hypothetical protein